MNLGTELTRYLAQGMDLQHRRVECCRYLKNGEPYQKHMEELVKWKQVVLAWRCPTAVPLVLLEGQLPPTRT